MSAFIQDFIQDKNKNEIISILVCYFR